MVGDMEGDGPYQGLGVKVWIGLGLWGMMGRDVKSLTNAGMGKCSRYQRVNV